MKVVGVLRLRHNAKEESSVRVDVEKNALLIVVFPLASRHDLRFSSFDAPKNRAVKQKAIIE